MSSKDLINQANISLLNNPTINQLNNKIKQKLNPIKKKIQKYSRKISKDIKAILNTSDIITRAKKNSYDLKDILYELDRDHKKNINKFKNLRKITNDNQYLLSNFMKKEKEEQEKNEDSGIKLNKKNESIKSTVNEEMSRQKMHKLLVDNILLMAKRREIFSYYLIKNKYQAINDEKKIRYIDKIREMIEIKQIQANDSINEREKKAKLQNIKYYMNQEKRIQKEMQENYNKLTQRLKQENDLSLKSIKETNDTLRSLKLNKSYLDEEIKLKYEHVPPMKLNPNNSKKKKIINRITQLDSNIRINNTYKYSNKYKDLIKLTNDEKTLRPNRKKSLVNIKRFILSKSTFKPKLISIKKNNNNISLDNQSISNNYSSIILDDDNYTKSRMNSVYEEIKHNNILLEKDKDFMKAYFENKKMKLSNKNRQAVTIMSNSLSRINEIDVTKKLKKINGQHIPEKYVNFFGKIETINKRSNNMKYKIFDSLCKVRMDD